MERVGITVSRRGDYEPGDGVVVLLAVGRCGVVDAVGAGPPAVLDPARADLAPLRHEEVPELVDEDEEADSRDHHGDSEDRLEERE